jgi:hypothetical protein
VRVVARRLRFGQREPGALPCLLFVCLVQWALLAVSSEMVCGRAFALSFGLGLIPAPLRRPRALLGRLFGGGFGRWGGLLVP